MNQDTSSKPTNHLIHESSPYLLQHAYNPVAWYPWGEAPFLRAEEEDKPILLSIGYSACHWCHVMAHESFENDEIAHLMNTLFINIKVDREERPDLDQIYQNAVQLFIRRGGGWPLTMFLMPNKLPFYGGTYFPPNDRHGLSSFPKMLRLLSAAYHEKRGDVTRTAENVQQALHAMVKAPLATGMEGQADVSENEIPPQIVQDAARWLDQIFDTTNGGFGGAPKFPSASSLHLFLRAYRQNRDETLLQKVTYTLGKMAWGGIYDQLGGGFHRYSTDASWQVPHFEKMLYDNAQLAVLYFSTYQATGQRFFKEIGEGILDYVLREMTDPDGGFYATQDADTEGEEGATFVWTDQEIREALGGESSPLFSEYYGVSKGGNFEGKNILHVTLPVEFLAKREGKSEEEVIKILQMGRQTLLGLRQKRVQPFRDEKILTSWNGLMISAFVTGFQVTGQGRYLKAAQDATAFIFTHLYREGRLLRTYTNGVGKLNGYLDDYAFLINGLIDLYETTFDPDLLSRAQTLAGTMITHYNDDALGGFFFTSDDHESLIVRNKPMADQSVPSGNALAAQLLLRLFYLTYNAHYFEVAEKTLRYCSLEMKGHVSSCASLIAAADLYLQTPKEIIVIGDEAEASVMVSQIHRYYLPNKTVTVWNPNRVGSPPKPAEGKGQKDGKQTVYLCHRFTCSEPLTEWNQIQEALQK